MTLRARLALDDHLVASAQVPRAGAGLHIEPVPADAAGSAVALSELIPAADCEGARPDALCVGPAPKQHRRGEKRHSHHRASSFRQAPRATERESTTFLNYDVAIRYACAEVAPSTGAGL